MNDMPASAAAVTVERRAERVEWREPAPAPAREQRPAPKAARATIRTYRQGLGDCHLVTLRGEKGATFRILIDCGVALATHDAAEKMRRVMDDVVEQCDGYVDLLVATHEHWDHLSGFVQAAESFARLRAGSVWMGWTEDPDDERARALVKRRTADVEALRLAAAQMQLRGSPGEANEIESVLAFFGAAGRASTKEALEAVRAKVAAPRYCRPDDPPFVPAGVGARIYVLGPPLAEASLKQMLPSRTDPETYKLAMDGFQQNVAPALSPDASANPFSTLYSIPEQVARGMPFFRQHYWDGEPARRIDTAWASDATEFALALDSMTNNTSLALAIDVDGVGVLLLPADAQVGSCLTWPQLEWRDAKGTVTGKDLLDRTVYYKVSHHGSYNGTLARGELDLMRNLQVAVIPVDHVVAEKMRWGEIPLPSLEAALDTATRGRGYVLRSDQEPPQEVLARGVTVTPDYFEVAL